MHPRIAVPAIIAIVLRAYRRNSLTVPALILAILTACIHALHPSSLPFALLAVFFIGGTTATKVKHEVKATLTLSSSGSATGEGPRGSIQVLANSGVATILCLIQFFRYGGGFRPTVCFGEDRGSDLVLLGIICNYAAVTADTFSSELGILSKARPRLITTMSTVPPGTNGGITLVGVLAGALGSSIIGLVSIILVNFCDAAGRARILSNTTMVGYKDNLAWDFSDKLGLWAAVTIWGTLGSLLDSLLGALLQASVIDRRTGKVVEGSGGSRVLVSGKSTDKSRDKESKKELSRSIASGRDILDNNQINFLMALLMTLGGIGVGASLLSWA